MRVPADRDIHNALHCRAVGQAVGNSSSTVGQVDVNDEMGRQRSVGWYFLGGQGFVEHGRWRDLVEAVLGLSSPVVMLAESE